MNTLCVLHKPSFDLGDFFTKCSTCTLDLVLYYRLSGVALFFEHPVCIARVYFRFRRCFLTKRQYIYSRPCATVFDQKSGAALFMNILCVLHKPNFDLGDACLKKESTFTLALVLFYRKSGVALFSEHPVCIAQAYFRSRGCLLTKGEHIHSSS